ncbi:MAG: amidohydrolase, partial [Oscillospiraceae bacterium]|nr:amidohydrolase [Oscillospiraceae bacterium]
MTTLFTNVTALLMDEGFTTLRGGYVAVEGTDISYVGTQRPAGEFDQTIDCAGKVMMPGFVNCHTHVPMTLMRGYGGGHN